jgi:hypothetical protein
MLAPPGKVGQVSWRSRKQKEKALSVSRRFSNLCQPVEGKTWAVLDPQLSARERSLGGPWARVAGQTGVR